MTERYNNPRRDYDDEFFRPAKDLRLERIEDSSISNNTMGDSTPARRAPPTGPQSNKFSFAFKASQKAPRSTAPNPEISEKLDKFPARAPARIDPAHNPARHIPTAPAASRRYDYGRDRGPRPRDPRDFREPYPPREPAGFRDNRDRRDVMPRRDPPRDAPREPAMAGKVRELIRDHREPYSPRDPYRDSRSPRHPMDSREGTPRASPREPIKSPQVQMEEQIRIVKKVVRRLKEKPQLPPEFKASESVYYRKPGNESVVGSGTYGKVFKAVHVYTGQLVALKKLRMEGERDGFPVTAIREIKLLQSLKHPNIVNLQEVMVEKNECFMVFEYLSHDLTGLLNHPEFTLSLAQKKDLAKQMFEGLEYLHRRSVLHRDIKAANILVSNTGQLKLADFGLARFYKKRQVQDYTNRVITIWYRSPELLLGETKYGPAVDIWSAACVMIEIFTGKAIFPGGGHEIQQLETIYNVIGTPNLRDWPGLKDMAWFELLCPTVRQRSNFAALYQDKMSEQAFDLLFLMFQYDPAKRPTAAEVLEHAYFTKEEPAPVQATELEHMEGDWHEFESKALKKENDKKEREAKKAAQKAEQEARLAAEAAAVNGETDTVMAEAGESAIADTEAQTNGDVLMEDAAEVTAAEGKGENEKKRPAEDEIPAVPEAEREKKRVMTDMPPPAVPVPQPNGAKEAEKG